MGRVNRLMERRALRRAADQALLTTLGHAQSGDAGGRPDQDFTYNRIEPTATAAPYVDHEPTTAPIPVIGDVAPDNYGLPDEDAPLAGSSEVPPPPADVYDLVPDQPVEPRWDDHVEVAAAQHAVTETPDDYGWDPPAQVPPASCGTRSASVACAPRRTRLLHPACPRLRRDRVAALVSQEARRRRTRGGDHRRAGVWRLAGLPEPGVDGRTVDRGADERTAATEHGHADGGECAPARSSRAAAPSPATPAAAGRPHVFRAPAPVFAAVQRADACAEAPGRRHTGADERRSGADETDTRQRLGRSRQLTRRAAKAPRMFRLLLTSS